jgi:signal transduction histidine kinase
MNDLLARLSPRAARDGAPPRRTEIAPIVEAQAATKRHAHPITVRADIPWSANADPGGLEQAIAHLVQNAIDASPAGAPIEIAIFESGGDVAIEILDQGCGMSGAFVRDRLFQPFVSTKDSGFGIGAFEARSLILAMGGRLDVESAEGEGTRFTLYLPGAHNNAIPSFERKRA